MEILGHIIGVIAIGLFFLSYQIFDKRKLLTVQTLATAAICACRFNQSFPNGGLL